MKVTLRRQELVINSIIHSYNKIINAVIECMCKLQISEEEQAKIILYLSKNKLFCKFNINRIVDIELSTGHHIEIRHNNASSNVVLVKYF